LKTILVLVLAVGVESYGYGAERPLAGSPPPISQVPNADAKNRDGLGTKGGDTNRSAQQPKGAPAPSAGDSTNKPSDQNSQPSTSRGGGNANPPSRGRPCFGYPDRPCL
jgi:hypothetical protein